MPAKRSCEWPSDDPLMIAYHDREWGTPVHDDRKQFEFLILEGAQAGLSWRTVLHKREAYRAAFARFDPEKVARFGARETRRLLADAGIIRNKLKIGSAIKNAGAFLAVQEEFGSFDRYVWRFVDGAPIQGRWKTTRDVPAKTRESEVMSKDLIQRGFRFVGPTICYAHMQATGMVNDHQLDCIRCAPVRKMGARGRRVSRAAP